MISERVYENVLQKVMNDNRVTGHDLKNYNLDLYEKIKCETYKRIASGCKEFSLGESRRLFKNYIDKLNR